jgi:enoyl-CoA hydratase/carnithine racemase
MLFASRHITVSADHGIATLAFGFGGEPANALNLRHFQELDRAIGAVAACPFVNVLVVRSSIPAGFCGGLDLDACASLTSSERASFAWYGQQVLDRLSRLDAVSVAAIEGPCLNTGLELALACDYRLCVAGPTTILGFPDGLTYFGGLSRLRQRIGRSAPGLVSSRRTFSGREAKKRGFIDWVCCERRAKIELLTQLDRLETSPRKRARSPDIVGAAAERRQFAQRQWQPSAAVAASARLLNPIPPFPKTVGLLGNNPILDRFAADVALRSGSVVLCGERPGIFGHIEVAMRRGFITPLEAEEARRRIRASDSFAGFDRAGLVLVASGQNAFRLAAAVSPRAIVCIVRGSAIESAVTSTSLAVPFPFARRVFHIDFCEANRVALFPDAATDPDAIVTVSSWLEPFEFTSVVFPLAARLLPRAA